jgi:mannose/fructose/N-acetylgalactosamine-specific phosphotransferase system component IIC
MLVPFAVVGRALDRTENAVHQRFADRAMQLVEQGEYRAALRMNWRSLWVPFGFGASITGLGVGVGGALGQLAPHLPARAQSALGTAFIFALAVCAAAAVRGARHPKGVALALVSAAATAGAVLLGR